MKSHAIVALGALLVASTPAFAWGCRGHQIIGVIAAAHLNPAVARQVDRILAADPIAADPRCPAGGLPLLAAMANWADDVRDRATAPDHYVNIPLGARRTRLDRNAVCQDACVTWAIAHFAAQVRTSTDPAQRADALRYVIHFVGDVHQPLHAVDNADLGGNCVETSFPGFARPVTLHSDWDTHLLAAAMGNAPDVAHFAAYLDARFGNRYARGSSNPADWAWESHDLAAKYAYGPLHIPVDPEPPAEACSTRQRQQPVETIDAAYIRQATPVVEQRLDQAGRRLANLLNRLWVN